VVSGVCRHILREALHKPENYGKWTINIEIKEEEKREEKWRVEGNRGMGEKIQKEKPEINSKQNP